VIARSLEELEPADRAVAVGTFDGVHRGHRAVIAALKGTGLRSTVLTFHPHPRAVLGGDVRLLSTFERRLELLEEACPDDVLVLEFTPEFSQLEPEEFVASVLAPIGTRAVVAGEKFRFGRQRRGDADLLRSLGIDVRPVPLVEGVSSSRIRELLATGDVRGAAVLLGRPPELEGTVVQGDRRGTELGYPTANLELADYVLVPAYGIYAGLAHTDGERYRTALSIGVNPHYGGSEQRIEPYLLDFEGDLYGRPLRVELWEYLRPERAFESDAELAAQIGRDVEAARAATPPA
jgi:riboflavin kinase/FMN adenylyltransferase